MKTALWEDCRKQFDHFRLTLGKSPGESRTRYLPGGTLCLSQGSLVGHYHQQEADKFGRWVRQAFVGKNKRLLHVITCYQACKTSLQGTNTTYAQQARAIALEDPTNLDAADPRERFKSDLGTLVKKLHDQGDEVVVVRDFNETMTSRTSGMAEMAADSGLKDVFAEVYGDQHKPTTFERGQQRIDFTLASPTLVPCIQQCGYEPFRYRFSTDHRGFYIDFATDLLLGDEIARLPPLPSRVFSAKDPKSVLAYVTARSDYMEDHKMYERIAELNNLTEPNHALLEAFDADLLRSAMVGENAVKKVRTIPWSPTLMNQRQKIHLLRTIISEHRTNRDMTEVLSNFSESLIDMVKSDFSDVNACKKELRESFKELRRIIVEAEDLRRQFLRERAEAVAAEGDKELEKILHWMERAEALSNMFRKIRGLRRKEVGSLTRLEIPKDPAANPKDIASDDSAWTTLDTPEEIEEALKQRNRKHFGQAHGTPYTSAKMQQHLDFAGNTVTSDLILQGTFQEEELNEITKLFTEHLEAKSPLDGLTSAVTANEFLGKLRHWREQTSTSPSGMNLSHYHTLFRPCGLDPESDEYQAYLRRRTMIIDAHLAVINYATKWQYSPTRWRKIVNVMILKDPGNRKIHRLRVIHIYEADYNLLLSTKWREAMHHAEDHGLLNEGMYGSRTGRTAHDPVYMEELQAETYRTSGRTGMKMDLDATSCYDRILPSLAGIASRRMGMHKNVVFVCAKTLEQAKYYLKTTLGLSDDSYTHCPEFPIYGTGQGSGNSPQLWCFLCSGLFDAYETKAHGATFTSPDGTETIRIFMIGFVDDCSLAVNQFDDTEPTPAPTLLSLLKRDCQLWNDLLWSSGGDLELSKCSFHYYHTKLSGTSIPYQSPPKTRIELFIQKGDRSTCVPIRMISPFSTHKTLGYYKCPSGNTSQQLAVMLAKAQDFARILRTNHLTRYEVWTMYSAIFRSSLGYPLPCSHFTQAELRDIDSAATGAFLNGMGYVCTFPTEVTYGSVLLGGTGMTSLYCLQGIGQLEMLLKHLRSEGQCHHLSRIAMAWTQFQIGTSISFLSDVTTPLPHSSSLWFMSLRTFLNTIDAKVEMDPAFTYPPERVNDRHIMDIVLAGSWSDAEIRMINHVRLFVNVITISDLTHPCGRVLDAALVEGKPSLLSSWPKHDKVHVGAPPPPAYTAWRKFIRSISTKRRLTRPLGAWLVNPTNSRRQWPTYLHYHTTPARIWRYDTQSRLYVAHYILPRKGVGARDPFLPELAAPPGIPAHLDDRPDGLYISGHQLPILQPPRIRARIPKTFELFCAALPEWESNLFSHLNMIKDPFTVASSLQQGACAGSDGSVEEDVRGAAAWVLSTLAGERLCACACHAPGTRPSSFRAEGYGVLSFLRFLIRLVEFTKTTGPFPTVLLHTDSQSFEKRLARHDFHWSRTPNSTIGSNYDVVHATWLSLNQSPVPVQIKWIKGHQDDDQPYALLPLPAQLNCDADRVAGSYQQNRGADQGYAPRLLGNPAQLIMAGRSIHTRLRTTIFLHYGRDELLSYTQKRFGWSSVQLDDVCLPVFSAAIKPFKKNRSTIIKNLFNHSPTARKTCLYGQTDSPCCPSCTAPVETEEHIILCPSPSRVAWRHQFLSSLDTFLSTKLSCDPTFVHVILTSVRTYLYNTPMPIDAYPDSAREACLNPLSASPSCFKADGPNPGSLFTTTHTNTVAPISPPNNYLACLTSFCTTGWMPGRLATEIVTDTHPLSNRNWFVLVSFRSFAKSTTNATTCSPLTATISSTLTNNIWREIRQITASPTGCRRSDLSSLRVSPRHHASHCKGLQHSGSSSDLPHQPRHLADPSG